MRTMDKNGNFSGDSSMGELPLFQKEDGGSIPTSPLHLRFHRISHKGACKMYALHHYLGDTKFISQINYGAYLNDALEGAISYGPPNATELDGYWDRHTQYGWWEIKRLALSDRCPRNSESRFIAYTMRQLRKTAHVKGFVSYADSGAGHTGIIYKASGFTYIGKTKPKMDFWVDGEIQQRGKTKGIKGVWKPRSVKHLFIKEQNG